jgi:Leucine-rich repeat (LRR) protein
LFLLDILKEKPRPRTWKAVLDLAEEEVMDGSTFTLIKSESTALRVNNNMLSNWDGFVDTITALFVDHSSHLQWLDLSFNDLKIIDDSILVLSNLTMLYLHGNNIKKMKEVEKLGTLLRLKSLSLHGNPIETVSGYRQYVLHHIPQLQTFDFSGVTKSDRKICEVWVGSTLPTSKQKKVK